MKRLPSKILSFVLLCQASFVLCKYRWIRMKRQKYRHKYTLAAYQDIVSQNLLICFSLPSIVCFVQIWMNTDKNTKIQIQIQINIGCRWRDCFTKSSYLSSFAKHRLLWGISTSIFSSILCICSGCIFFGTQCAIYVT